MREEQFIKHSLSMEVTPSGIVMEVREKQLLKHDSSMVVMPSGITIEVSLPQPLKVRIRQNVVRVEGMVMEVSEEQYSKQYAPK